MERFNVEDDPEPEPEPDVVEDDETSWDRLLRTEAAAAADDATTKEEVLLADLLILVVADGWALLLFLSFSSLLL